MPLVPSFTVSQSALSPSVITLTDTSSGSDVAITNRRIYFADSEGNFIVPTGTLTSYVEWPYADATIDVDLLSEDMALSILVQWLDVGNAVLYSSSNPYCLSQFSKVFLYYLIQLQGLTPNILQATNYDKNTYAFWATIRGAINAVEIGSDIAASQNCLNRCNQMRLKQNNYF